MIELLVVVSIAGILLAVGIPSFQNLSRTTRLTTQANTIVSSIHLARNEAITRGLPVTIESISGTTDWTSGWRVYLLDTNGDEILVRRYDRLEKSILEKSGVLPELEYRPNGFIDEEIIFTLEDDNCVAPKPWARKVTIERSGHASTEKDVCS